MTTLRQRFEDKVKPCPDTGCHRWTAGKSSDGAGKIKVEGNYQRANRVAWRLYRGVIPEGDAVLLTCKTKDCVNPAHMFTGPNLPASSRPAPRGKDAGYWLMQS